MSQLPPGFVLDQQASAPGLPPGFELDGPSMESAAPARNAEPDSAITRRVRGLAQTTVVPAAQLMARGMDLVGNTANRIFTGKESEYLKELPQRADMFAQELRDQREAGRPDGFDLASVEGEALGTAPAFGLRAAARPILNRLAQGAVAGGQLAPTNEAGAGSNVATSAAVSAVVPPVLSRIVSPAANAAVRMLAERGVRMTPGQILGPTAKRIEDAARSIPLLGDAISSAQRRSFGSFNEAVINDALQPINGRVQGAGREAVAQAQDQVSHAYNSLLPQLRVAADGQFIREVQGVQQIAQSLPPELQPRFNHILQNEVLSKFTPQGRMSGEMMKDVETQLGQIAKSYQASADPFERRMAGGVRELQGILRGVTERSNPQHAGQLRAINQAYARMQRVNDAAARVTSEDGVFTPEAFSGAVKKGDVSKGKRRYARGEAQSQELSDAARQVMGNRVPDSGTARRMMTGIPVAGGVGFIEPNALALGAIAAAPYLPIGEGLVRNALLRRPAGAAQFANALRNRGGALTGPALAALTESR